MPRPDASAKLAASKPKDNSKLNLIISVVLVGVLIIGGFAAVILTRDSGSTDAAGPANSQASGNGVLAYPGKAKAGVPDVQLYVDYQCPICNDFEQANGGQMMQMAQAGEIKLTIHVMSFLDNNLGNKSSAQAANASFCASDAGLMPEFHTELFKHQPAKEGDGYPTSVYAQVAQQVGIKGAALSTFNQCVSDAKYAKYVDATEVRSNKNGVTGTPTVIINGKSSSDDKQMFQTLVQTPNSFRSIVEQNAKKS